MKKTLLVALMLLSFKGLAQSPAEIAILKLSGKIFTCEVENKIDSLNEVFDERFTAFTSAGEMEAAFVKIRIN